MSDIDIDDDETETHEQVTERHARELGALLTEHRDRVARSHADYPTPRAAHRRGDRDGWWLRMTDEERIRWNQRAAVIAGHNRDYARAVRDAVVRHQSENHNLNTPAVVAAGLAAFRLVEDNRRRAAR